MRTLFTTTLKEQHAASGFTRHYVGSQLAPVPTFLALAQFTPEEGVYLLYLDHNNEEITDTLHADVAAAMAQAHAEFGVKESDWISYSEHKGD
jgi:hypothetical protein